MAEAGEAVRKHAVASLQYMENGLAMLNQREAGKASELLWGSMTQAVQAVAASRGTALKNHRSLRWFVAQVARELDDKPMAEGFYQAEGLHSNFHEVDMTPEEVMVVVESIQVAVQRLLSLLPQELLRET